MFVDVPLSVFKFLISRVRKTLLPEDIVEFAVLVRVIPLTTLLGDSIDGTDDEVIEMSANEDFNLFTYQVLDDLPNELHLLFSEFQV